MSSKPIRYFWQFCCWAWLGLAFSAYAVPAKMAGIKISEKKSPIRITIQLSTPVQPRIFSLTRPDRLVLDFTNVRSMAHSIPTYFKHPEIRKIRTGRLGASGLRLVIDLNMPAHFKVVSRLPAKSIVIDLFLEKKKPANVRRITIMIDPGHGGKDTGAIGALGTQEKDVVLAIARELAALINQQPGMQAVLTRNGDYYVTLHNRLVYARNNKADAFISIHADSYFNNRASGVSVYALSKNGATSIAARWLARRDNYFQLEGVPLAGLDDQSYMLRSVLIDLAQTATIKDSLRLGTALLDALDNVTTLHYSRIEQAPFMVLKSPDIPSILVEMGFISNRREELRLRGHEYQHKTAVALFNGVRFYQKKYAVLGD